MSSKPGSPEGGASPAGGGQRVEFLQELVRDWCGPQGGRGNQGPEALKLKARKGISNGIVVTRYMGGSYPEGVMSSGQKETVQESPEVSVGTRMLGDDVGKALIITQELDPETVPVRTPHVGSHNDGDELLEGNASCLL